MNDDADIEAAGRALEKRAKKAFDESVEALDSATLSRLNKARNEAIASAAGPRLYRGRASLLPAAGVAAAVLVAVLLITGNETPIAPVGSERAADLEILLNGDDLEMLEDLEFYSWIELEPETASNVG